jgi:hypothetical protein
MRIPTLVVDGQLLPPGEGEPLPLSFGSARFRPHRRVPELGRFQFLEELGPVEKVVGLKAFGCSGAYQAFVVRVGSGRRIALVDAIRRENAMYVFMADSGEWLQSVQLPKPEARRSHEFLQRVLHVGRWQERVRALLAEL